MAIYCIVATASAPAVLAAAQKVYAPHFYRVADNVCLVSASGTAIEVSQRIGLVNGEKTGPTGLGSAVITSVGSYFGIATPDLWEWMRTEWERPGV